MCTRILNLGGGPALDADNGATHNVCNFVVGLHAVGDVDFGTADTVFEASYVNGDVTGTAVDQDNNRAWAIVLNVNDADDDLEFTSVEHADQSTDMPPPFPTHSEIVTEVGHEDYIRIAHFIVGRDDQDNITVTALDARPSL